MTDESYRYAEGDRWTRRGLAVDARASSRGDIMADEPGAGCVYPRYVARGRGAYVWDVDGNRYVDYLLGYGPVVLGHADERVTAAAVAQLADGNCFAPLWHPRQVELTELLTSVIPGAESAYLMKTGSEANTAALRLARIFTGRDKVVRWGYNGWHDWAALSPAGIPATTRADTLLPRRFGAAVLRELFEQHPDEIAAVLTMPFEWDPVTAAELHEMRRVTHEYGALFVLDEMRSGFRLALGGAQQFFGVRADLAAYSKAMANGYPISAVVGRADVLAGLSRTRISSTFYAGPVEMAAALATIDVLRRTDALDRIRELGTVLQDGLRALVEEFSVPATVVGYPVMPFLRFDGAAAAKRAFFAETARRGVLLHPDHQWFLSAAHTMDDIADTLDACRAAFRVAAPALEPR